VPSLILPMWWSATADGILAKVAPAALRSKQSINDETHH